MLKERVAIGDVVRSEKFAFGRRGLTDWVSIHPQIAEGLSDARGPDDPTRAEADFVVVTAAAEPFAPPGEEGLQERWVVHARRLAHDGSYDPEGEEIKFVQQNGIVSVGPIEVVRTLSLNSGY